MKKDTLARRSRQRLTLLPKITSHYGLHHRGAIRIERAPAGGIIIVAVRLESRSVRKETLALSPEEFRALAELLRKLAA